MALSPCCCSQKDHSMQKKTFFLILYVFVFAHIFGQDSLIIQTGDILFQTSRSRGSFVKAIQNVTSSMDDLNFSHVGVAYKEDSLIYVLEASPMGGVVKTPLKKFLKQSFLVNGKPLVVVKRLKNKYRYTIPAAIERIESLYGKKYDYVFSPYNDEYYCSELIYLAFLDKKGRSLFKAAPMTFKDKDTGKTNPYWLEHFERHKTPVPEGVIGTNPGDMSKSKKLVEVYRFF